MQEGAEHPPVLAAKLAKLLYSSRLVMLWLLLAA